MERIYQVNEATLRRQQSHMSYSLALSRYRTRHGLARISWLTWSITLITVAIWCFTAYQTALAAGAHSLHAVIANIISNAITIQNKENDALTSVLITYGAKDNALIRQGQYWRFIMPIFLHANLLHIGLNMLNFALLGVFVERLVGQARFLLIYLVTGVVATCASCLFSPQDISVGASGAIFGLVGAYSIFIFVHRRAFMYSGIPALLWLVLIIGLNLAIGLFMPNVDNYAHLGGLLSGMLLGWWFMPLYRPTTTLQSFSDAHSLTRRWPLALVTLLGTFILAIITVHFMGG